MKKLTIITQNLNRKLDIENINKYIDEYEADIYAFQELKSGRYGITEIIDKPNYKEVNEIYKEIYKGNSDEERLMKCSFPWLEFKSGYWMEKIIKFDNKEIIIFNFHSSLYYSIQLRYVLLKRLEELKGKYVILLGDFNAAFKYQSENIIPENDQFLSFLTNKYEYMELCNDKEDEKKPHYTFMHHGKRKKLDHIFVSKNLYHNIRYKINYIDEVNYNFDEYKKNKGISTDHFGIKLTFSFKFQ